jgi:CBS domain-containing protein
VYEFLDYKTRDVMTREPVTVAPDAPLREAEGIFDQHNFNALPVVAPGGEVVGLLSKLDIPCTFRFTEDHMIPPHEEITQDPVSSVMSRDLHCVCPRTRSPRKLGTA